MDTASDTSTETTESTIDTLSDQIGGTLFPETPEPDLPADTQQAAQAGPAADHKATVQPAATSPQVRHAPKTWPKEMHPHWEKTPKEVQDYWETREKQMLDGLGQYKDYATYGKGLRDALASYDEDFRSNGVDHATGIKFLLEANRKLTSGPVESRKQAYEELGQKLGLTASPPTNGQAVDPTVQRLLEEMNQIKSGLTAQQQRVYQETKAKVTQEVDAFASDTKAHPYFDECADHIVRLIQAGYSLQEAYETAVMANPVTKAKEIARIQTEYEAKLKENARLSSLPKKKAAGVNVQSQDTRRGGPTDPLGSMEDTIREAVAAQRARAS